jgi:hypothetical protein
VCKAAPLGERQERLGEHVGIVEEGLFRGRRFRFLEEGLVSWVALVLTPHTAKCSFSNPYDRRLNHEI